MIYLLEDDESIRELVIYTLKSQGYEAKGFERPSLFWKELENPDSEFSKFYRDTITSEDPDLKKAATFIRKLQNILQSDKKESFSLIKAIPNFIIWFLVASLITTVTTSLGASATVFAPLKNLSKFMIIMAMTAIGYQTNLKKLITKGGSALLLGGLCWVLISLASLLMQKILGLW